MVNLSHVFRYLLVIALFASLASFVMVGCEDPYTPTGTKKGLSDAWTMYDTEVDATHIRSIAFLTADKGFLVGRNGAVLSTADGGTTWQQLERVSGGTLWDIEFVGDTGLIIGDGSTVLRTIDGGSSWIAPIVRLGDNDLYDIDFTGNHFTWVVGSGGLIMLSENSGSNWKRELPMETIDTSIDTVWINPDSSEIDTFIVTSFIPIGSIGSFEALRGVSFAIDAIGIVVGDDGKIAITSDTAQTWSDPTTNPSVAALNDVIMLSVTDAVAVGNNGTVLRTTNAGVDWTAIDVGGLTDNLFSVEFSGASAGWISGENGTLLMTSDGGASWTPQTSGTHLDLWDASFVSATDGWAAGDFTIVNTANGGSDWTTIKSKTTALPTLHAIAFTDANHGWAVGDAGTIVSTDDGGASWLLLQHRDDFWLNDVQFLTATEGWAVGGRGAEPYNALIQHTVDGGLTWTEQTNWVGIIDTFNCSSMDTSWIKAIDMLDASNGFAVGGKWTTAIGGIVLSTTDGGATWTSLAVIADTLFRTLAPDGDCHPGQSLDTVIANRASRFHGVSFVDANTGWAVGMAGIIIKTTDAGAAWEHQNTKYACQTFDEETGACTDSAIVSGGYLFYDLNDVYFADVNTGWAVGTADTTGINVILYTVDGGATWTRQDVGSGVNFQDIAFSDASNGWIAGTGGAVLVTSDGGLTWSEIATNAGDLLGIEPISTESVWIVGEEGLLIQTTSGGQ